MGKPQRTVREPYEDPRYQGWLLLREAEAKAKAEAEAAAEAEAKAKAEAEAKAYQDLGPKPTATGCHMAMPMGCPNQPWNTSANSYKWFDPTAGSGSLEACEQRRQDHIQACGTTHALMAYNPYSRNTAPVPYRTTAQTVLARATKLGSQHRAHIAYFFISHSNQKLEDRSGTVGLTDDLGANQTWRLVFAGGPNGYYIISVNDQRLEDRNGVLELHSEANPRQVWTIMGASAGEYYIISHRNQKLEDRNGVLGLHDDSGPFQKWSIHCAATVPPPSTQCYARLPRGCSRYMTETTMPPVWFNDGATSRTACDQRRQAYNAWCGRDDAVTVFHHEKPAQPPGSNQCWIRLPTTCQNTNLPASRAGDQWFVDPTGFHAAAGPDKTSCALRVQDFNGVCNRTDTEVSFSPDHSAPLKLVQGDTHSHSSLYPGDHSTTDPSNGTLDGPDGWIMKYGDSDPWYQMQSQTPVGVAAVITRGRTKGVPQWVTSFKVQIKPYTGFNEWIDEQTFATANIDDNTRFVGGLSTPVVAQVVRIVPLTWHSWLVLRVGLLVHVDFRATPLDQFEPGGGEDGYMYTIKGHKNSYATDQYLTLTVAAGPNYIVYMSDVNFARPIDMGVGHNSTSQWHLVWHQGMVRLIARGTKTTTSAGLALFKDGTKLTCKYQSGYHQHFWHATYKGPLVHGRFRFQLAFACNHASQPCAEMGAEIVSRGRITSVNLSTGLSCTPSKFNSEDAAWFEALS